MKPSLSSYIASDLFRHNGAKGTTILLKKIAKDSLFRLTVLYRITSYLYKNNISFILWFFKGYYRRIQKRHGLNIPYQTKIGFGMIIHHGVSLVISPDAIIGDNVLLTHQVSILSDYGEAPIIGNQVRFAPGAVVLGGVKIGNNTVIGANCVVVTDVPDNDVAVGNPNKNLGRKFKDFTDRYYWENISIQ